MPKKIPVATVALGLVGLGSLLRGLWNPHRAVVRRGSIADCPGPSSFGVCESTLDLASPVGTPVYATGGGRVVSVGPSWVHVQVGNEPVILFYTGVSPSVEVGQYVMRGRKLGTSQGTVGFAVYEIQALSPLKMTAVEPASWLAARGYRTAVDLQGGENLWCGAGRHVVVPREAHHGCSLAMPDTAGFALLPASIQQE